MAIHKRQYPYNLYYAILSEDTDADENTLRENVGFLLLRLTERERRILLMRYSEGFSYAGIGARYNLTRSRIQEICRGSLNRMRSPADVFILREGVAAYITFQSHHRSRPSPLRGAQRSGNPVGSNQSP